MQLQQISVPIENQAGRLYALTHELGRRGINILALNLVDNGHFGELRMLVSDVTAARQMRRTTG